MKKVPNPFAMTATLLVLIAVGGRAQSTDGNFNSIGGQTQGGSSPQFKRVTIKSSTDNMNHAPLGDPCTETFDFVNAPGLPAGWVASNPVPGDGTLWVTSIITPDTVPNAAFIPDQDGISDKLLDSRPIPITSASAVLSFRNNFNTEFSDGTFWDGGVLEVSSPNINGGAFTDITAPAVGGTIVSGGYTGIISNLASNPLAGRMAWSGSSGGYITTVINLGATVNGQTITLRFRMGTDEAVNAPGWNVDTISITGACGTAPSGIPVIFSPLSVMATVGQLFIYQIVATDYPTDYAGAPDGLNIDKMSGVISGIPTAAGMLIGGLGAGNSNGYGTATLMLAVQNAPPGPVIVSSTCATARTGRAFSFQLQTSGGSAATHFAVDNLPPGLNLDPSTGYISGTPTSVGSFLLAVSAIDGAAITHATLQLTFTSDPTVPTITSASSLILTPGQFFSYRITADATGSTFGYVGTDGIVHRGASNLGLPGGLNFDGVDTISGTFNPQFGQDGRPDQSGGIITNVQLFAANPTGTGTFPLINFIAARGTVNISTRLAVGTGDHALIGGFIITGTGTTRALIRALGPSLTQFPNALQDPMLELRNGAGSFLGSNDNWRDNQSIPIMDTGIPPPNDLESAILAYLSPGSYTAIVSGRNNTTGVALVEVYDLGLAYPTTTDHARLANISTRGVVETGDNAIIGGFILLPQAPATSTRVVVRALGPSLSASGIAGALPDPTLELKDSNGGTLISNDDWQQGPPADIQEIQTLGLAPVNIHESALIQTLPTGGYTAIVRGNGGTTGVALVEVYALQ